MASATFNEGVSLAAPPAAKAVAATPAPTVPSPSHGPDAGNETGDANKGKGKGKGLPTYQKAKKAAKCLVSREPVL